MHKRLQSILGKLRVVARALVKFRPHAGIDDRVRPPLSERTVREFERRHAIELPEGFRAFLTTVANGAPGPGGTMPPLSRSFDRDFLRSHPRHLRRAFPFGSADAERILRIRRDEEPDYGERLPRVSSQRPAPGILDVGEWNAGMCAGLVVAPGEQHGAIWWNGHYPGWALSAPAEVQGAQTDFLDWYEAWLRNCLIPGALRRNPRRPIPRAEQLEFFHPVAAEIPRWVWRCEHLRSLSFWHNEAVQVPDDAGNLGALRHLSIHGSPAHLSPAVFDLRELEELDVGFSSLGALPDELCHLVNLRQLNLEHNGLRRLPADFGALRRLEVLSLRWNALSRLPASFGRLRTLRVLNLASNKLKQLPASFARLEQLGGLDLNNNPVDLAQVCEVLAKLPRLKRLVLPAPANDTDLEPLGLLRNLRRIVLPGISSHQRTCVIELLPGVEV